MFVEVRRAVFSEYDYSGNAYVLGCFLRGSRLLHGSVESADRGVKRVIELFDMRGRDEGY